MSYLKNCTSLLPQKLNNPPTLSWVLKRMQYTVTSEG